jgi:hypothetical protein
MAVTAATRRAQRGTPLSRRSTTAPQVPWAEVIDAFVAVFDDVYAHLQAKRARYGVDVVQRLRVLREQLDERNDREIDAALSAIVVEMRDAHTRYRGIDAVTGEVAALPFLVESYGQSPSYVVTKVADSLVKESTFQQGVRLESWNGVPFERAVMRWGLSEYGGRPDSRRARALQSLTLRPLGYGPAPDEEWVIVGYRDGRSRREVRLPWRVVTPFAASVVAPPLDDPVALDAAAEIVRRAKLLLYAPETWQRSTGDHAAPAQEHGGVETSMPDNIRLRIVQVGRRRVAHLRLWSFVTLNVDTYLDELQRLVTTVADLPIVVDLRGNPGGRVGAAERALQLFSARPIAPCRFAWRSSQRLREAAMSTDNPRLQPWAESLRAALVSGDGFAQPIPLVDERACNDRGQVHRGGAVALVDALTFSAGDLFAAGWVDHQIGPLVTIGSASGGGGADVLDISDLSAMLGGALPPLPSAVGLSVSCRRITRRGLAEGLPIEDVGVVGLPWAMTRRDVTSANEDMLRFCVQQLAH